MVKTQRITTLKDLYSPVTRFVNLLGLDFASCAIRTHISLGAMHGDGVDKRERRGSCQRPSRPPMACKKAACGKKLVGFTLGFLVVMGHLETGSSKAALNVKTFVSLAAVENALVTASLLGNKVEGLDDSEAEFLALLVLCDGDILNVADGAKTVNAV
jgi:hypothetical protein